MIVVAFWTCWGESPGAGAAFAFRTVGLGLHAAGFGGGGCTAAVATPGPGSAGTSSMPTRALAVRRFMATRVWEWWATAGDRPPVRATSYEARAGTAPWSVR